MRGVDPGKRALATQMRNHSGHIDAKPLATQMLWPRKAVANKISPAMPHGDSLVAAYRDRVPLRPVQHNQG